MAEILGPSVRDVFTFGWETFPNARRDWPRVGMPFDAPIQELQRCERWCDANIGYRNWFRFHRAFFFNSDDDALLFRLRWL